MIRGITKMIPIKNLNDHEWYLENINRFLVHGNTKSENINKALQDKLKRFSNELSAIGISIKDFSCSKGRTLFEEFIVAGFEDLTKVKLKIDATKKTPFTSKLTTIYNRFSKANINNLIVDKFALSVCPYCNENYIINRDKNKAMAQLDHFYSREKYPLFSICLYNLVPACYACNHIKQAKALSVSPYDQNIDFNSMKISYEPKSANWLNDHTEISINFNPINADGEKIYRNIRTLQIEGSYKYHSDYVQEILKKEVVYSNSRLNELLIKFPSLFSSEEELLRLVFGNYIKEVDLNRRPLSKLTKDILEELGVIKV